MLTLIMLLPACNVLIGFVLMVRYYVKKDMKAFSKLASFINTNTLILAILAVINAVIYILT